MSSHSSAVGSFCPRGLRDGLGGLLFDFSVESIVVVTLIEVDLEDLSDLRLLPRSATGEIDVAGAAINLPRCRAVDGLDVLPSLIPNSAVFVEAASKLEAAPDEWAVEGASNTPSRAGSIADPIRLITYQSSLCRWHAQTLCVCPFKYTTQGYPCDAGRPFSLTEAAGAHGVCAISEYRHAIACNTLEVLEP